MLGNLRLGSELGRLLYRLAMPNLTGPVQASIVLR
jgi:hypothetical protein